jgi:hypothetical protein
METTRPPAHPDPSSRPPAARTATPEPQPESPEARQKREIAERATAAPEPPTPTQAEADAMKTGEYVIARETQRRDMRAEAAPDPYKTR